MVTAKKLQGKSQIETIMSLTSDKEKRSGIGAVWSNTTSSISSSFKVVERLAVSAESLAESAEMNAEQSLAETAEEFCNSMGLIDEQGNPYKGFQALMVARMIRGR